MPSFVLFIKSIYVSKSSLSDFRYLFLPFGVIKICSFLISVPYKDRIMPTLDKDFSSDDILYLLFCISI